MRCRTEITLAACTSLHNALDSDVILRSSMLRYELTSDCEKFVRLDAPNMNQESASRFFLELPGGQCFAIVFEIYQLSSKFPNSIRSVDYFLSVSVLSDYLKNRVQLFFLFFPLGFIIICTTRLSIIIVQHFRGISNPRNQNEALYMTPIQQDYI